MYYLRGILPPLMVFELQPGIECKAAFKGQHFQAEVLAVGKF